MNNTDIESELLIKAINNEIRRNIIRLLMGKSMSYTEIAHLLHFNLKKESGKFNFHLKQLLEVGIVDNDNDDEHYKLTAKGEEMYYLLLDIERDKQIDPHGMLTALIRLDGPQEFWFYTSSLGMIASLWAVMIGLVAIFLVGDGISTRIYGIVLTMLGIIVGPLSVRYYFNTVNDLLGKRSKASKIFSTILFISIQWYLIRTKNRTTYLIATFVILFGWFTSLLSALLHLSEGVENVGVALYWLEILAVIMISLGIILLRNLYISAKTQIV